MAKSLVATCAIFNWGIRTKALSIICLLKQDMLSLSRGMPPNSLATATFPQGPTTIVFATLPQYVSPTLGGSTSAHQIVSGHGLRRRTKRTSADDSERSRGLDACDNRK